MATVQLAPGMTAVVAEGTLYHADKDGVVDVPDEVAEFVQAQLDAADERRRAHERRIRELQNPGVIGEEEEEEPRPQRRASSGGKREEKPKGGDNRPKPGDSEE